MTENELSYYKRLWYLLVTQRATKKQILRYTELDQKYEAERLAKWDGSHAVHSNDKT